MLRLDRYRLDRCLLNRSLIDMTGLVKNRIHLKIKSYCIRCVPYDLSLASCRVIALPGKREIDLFQHYRDATHRLNFTMTARCSERRFCNGAPRHGMAVDMSRVRAAGFNPNVSGVPPATDETFPVKIMEPAVEFAAPLVEYISAYIQPEGAHV